VHITNVKIKLPMRLTKYYAMKTYPLLKQVPLHEVLESGGIAPRILNLGIRRKWVVIYMPRPL